MICRDEIPNLTEEEIVELGVILIECRESKVASEDEVIKVALWADRTIINMNMLVGILNGDLGVDVDPALEDDIIIKSKQNLLGLS